MARTRRMDSTRVSAALPLALLEALHARDRSKEVPPLDRAESDHPQPLGLTDVVHAQIRLHRRLGARRRVPTDDVQHLLRLISRRRDAREIFEHAGYLAARSMLRRAPCRRLVLRALPRGARLRAARRYLWRVTERLAAAKALRVTDTPMGLEIEDGLTARARAPEACRLYTALLEEILAAHTRTRWRARHDACQARGDARCTWSAEEKAGGTRSAAAHSA